MDLFFTFLRVFFVILGNQNQNINENERLIEPKTPAELKMEQDLCLLGSITAKHPRLKSIVFENVTDEDMIFKICVALSKNPHITNVKLKSCAISEKAIQLLSDNKSIVKLVLDSCVLKMAHIVILSKSTSIKHLSLANSNIGNEPAVALAKKNKTLVFLDLSNNDIENSGFREYIKHPTIKFLFLDNNKITSEGTAGIELNKTFYHLSLENNKIGDEGFAKIATCESIVKLNLRKTGITDEGAIRVGSTVRAAYVWLGLNDIRSDGLTTLAQNENIIHLCLESNLLGSDDAMKLSENKCLVSVNLDGNYVGSLYGVRAFSKNSRLTSCKVANSYIISSRHNTFPTFMQRLKWSASHAGNTAKPVSYKYLTPKIEMNKKRSAELAELCLKAANIEKTEMDGMAEMVQRFMTDKGVLPYGDYFNSLLRGSPSVLHLAVENRNSPLLNIMTEIMPHSLLYFRGEGDDGLTYEEYAEKIGFEVPEKSKSHIIIQIESEQHQSEYLNSYGTMLSDKLLQMKIGAAGRANGLVGEDLVILQIIGIEPTVGKPIAAGISKLLNYNKKENPVRIFSWLRESYDLRILVDELKRAQFDAKGILKKEQNCGNIKFLENDIILSDAKSRQGRKLNYAEKRAVLDMYKLFNFMGSIENNPHASNEEWLNKLMKAVMGSGYRYMSSAPMMFSVELKEPLDIKEQELRKKTDELNKVKESLEEAENELENEKKKVKEREDEIVKLQKSILGLKKELEEKRLKYQSLDAETQAGREASASRIEELADALNAYENILDNLYSSCHPSSKVSGATNSRYLTDRDRRNSASHLTIATQAANITSQTSASFNAKI